MTKLFKNSKSILSLVLAFAVLAASLFTGVAVSHIHTDAASCKDDLAQLNVVYANSIDQTAPTKGTGTEADPYIIENASHIRYIAQKSTPATTYGVYYKVSDDVDILVFQSEAYINAVAGSLANFLALDAEGVKTALSTTDGRIQYQSGSTASSYDGFAGNIDFNGVTICGMYNQNGGVIANVNGGATLENLTLCNNLIESGWYNGNLVGYVHNGTATQEEYRTLTISNVVVHDCYQTTTGNGYAATGVLLGTAVNTKNIPLHISNILTYDNISLGTVSSSDSTEKECALYGALTSSWNGDSVGVANASYSNIVTLDCVPYPTQNINNQSTKPAYWSNVYTAVVDAQDREPCSWYQDGDQWNLFDITKLSSADLAKGTAAKTNMPKLDWTNVWVAVDGAYPELQAMHEFKDVDNGDGTHTTKCAECSLSIGTVAHNYTDGVCGCGYTAKCGEVILFWDGSTDAALADNGEAGTEANPIIIDNAAELNYLANSVTGGSTAGKLYYKMADGIDKVVLQPKGVLDLDALLACADGAAVKAYFETVGTENLENWAETNSTNETWFAGTFDGNGTEFVGMYVYDGSAGLFITADGGATFKNLAVTHSYIYGSKNKVDGSTNGQCRTGAIVGGTCGVGYGAKVQGTVSFDSVLVADNYIRSDRGIGTIGLVMGTDNSEEAAAINNAIVYGNDASCAEEPDSKPYLFNGMGVEGVSHSTVSNSIILGGAPYYGRCKAAEYFTNVYTDADTTGYEEANIKSVAGLTGAELVAACDALDWTNTFLATADMPTFRAMHDAEFDASYDDETHSVVCSCGLAISEGAHVWGTEVDAEQGYGYGCTECDYVCDCWEVDEWVESEIIDPTCTEAGQIIYKCDNCGFIDTENPDVGDDATGHNLSKVTGTEPKCEETGIKDYWECTNEGCDAVFADADETPIEGDFDEWKVIPATGHTHAVDNDGVAVYVVTDEGHQKLCGVCEKAYGEVESHVGEPVDNGDGTHSITCTVAGCGYAAESAPHNYGDDNVCDTCNNTCTNHVWVDDGEAQFAAEATDDVCKVQAQKCEICGIAGEDKTIGHELSDWATNPRAESTPACAGDGSHTEIRYCIECWYNGGATPSEEFSKVVTDPKTGHEFTENEASDPTCTFEGMVAHKYCPNCNYSFALDAAEDEAYENALTDEQLYIPVDAEAHVWVEYEAADADCENDGYAQDHKFCSECYTFVIGEEETDIVIDYEKFYEREYADEDDWVGTPVGYGAIADAYATELYEEMFAQYLADLGVVLPEEPAEDADWDEWNAYYEEYYTIMDAVDTAAFEEEWAPILESIFTEAYHQYFLAAAADREEGAVELVIPAKGHTLTKVDEVAATYEKDGTKAHWACECGKLYSDAEGKNEVTAESLVIAKLVKEEEKPADKPAGDNGDKSPATGENVASVAAVAALMGAAFVLVRKSKKA